LIDNINSPTFRWDTPVPARRRPC